ncbi:hypothetical protein [Sphingomonas nostoxanthinifaciens]|uniref:hypothetical protein n=1 Tax=Sphingomonas nostoxanthinifaciens TaxID=2872652 RepID=UPI001CC1E305|nr:hypothetical protein [Sphingomonas nostoxanthinifaciens]UAK26411.1 hypothetical protein K8P63_10160 [Sphingomonas nostoxanthinifaciens]
MKDAARIVTRRSIFLWIGSALVFAMNLWAGTTHDLELLKIALAATLALALAGIGFGIWAGFLLNKRSS